MKTIVKLRKCNDLVVINCKIDYTVRRDLFSRITIEDIDTGLDYLCNEIEIRICGLNKELIYRDIIYPKNQKDILNYKSLFTNTDLCKIHECVRSDAKNYFNVE